MTLTGYRFMATGVTEYAFYNGSDRLLRIAHTALPPVCAFSPQGSCTPSLCQAVSSPAWTCRSWTSRAQ